MSKNGLIFRVCVCMSRAPMERWILFIAVVLAAAAAVQGAGYLSRGKRSRWTVLWMLGSFVCQIIVMGARGEQRGSCPLGDTGEMLIFASWAVTMCYLAVGSVFRLSLLGVFTAPLVCFLLSMALIPGMLDPNPPHADHVDAWREAFCPGDGCFVFLFTAYFHTVVVFRWILSVWV